MTSRPRARSWRTWAWILRSRSAWGRITPGWLARHTPQAPGGRQADRRKGIDGFRYSVEDHRCHGMPEVELQAFRPCEVIGWCTACRRSGVRIPLSSTGSVLCSNVQYQTKNLTALGLFDVIFRVVVAEDVVHHAGPAPDRGRDHVPVHRLGYVGGLVALGWLTSAPGGGRSDPPEARPRHR